MTRAEMEARGWAELDVLLITGDAYVDHPSFGAAMIGRVLEAGGFKVGIVAQPRWDWIDDVARLGRPRLFAGVTAGSLDSMLAHYTAFRKKRRDDAYSPGGRAGLRPNRASIVYASLAKQAFPGLPVVLGGIEASLRRASHYDFWSDKVRRSIVLDAKADLVVYGMGERAVAEIARRLADAGDSMEARREALAGVAGAVYAGEAPAGAEVIRLPSHEEIEADPIKLMQSSLLLEQQVHEGRACAAQEAGGRLVVMTPPPPLLSTAELDALYELPFTGRPHPSYGEAIPAVQMIRWSITSHRGCGGGCSFCSLALHQGRRVSSRSVESLVRQAGRMAADPDFRGSISDVGGPTANMWGARCDEPGSPCRRASCLTPGTCKRLQAPQSALLDLLDQIAAEPGVKHVRVASGVRHDLALLDQRYLRGLVERYVGGQLKIAPEHSSDRVLALMRKPAFASFERFIDAFVRLNRQANKEQYVTPYLISAFPGCTESDMEELAQWLASRGWRPQQVQCFIPTPGTVATAMYHAGVDPKGRTIKVARTDAERQSQHRLLLGERRQGRG